MNRIPVLATGIGVCSPNGSSIDEFWQSCVSGKTGISCLEWAEAFRCRSQVCGRVPDGALRAALRPLPGSVAALGRHHQLGLAAAFQAVQDASITPDALVLGTATGGFQGAEEFFSGVRGNFNTRSLYFDESAETVARYLRIRGPRRTISTGCTSSTDAVGFAAWMIRHGLWNTALVVGSEGSLTPSTHASFEALGAVTGANNDRPGRASRPFSKDRSGFVLGEGAGAVVLERGDLAEVRGAKVYAEFCGFGSVNNAFHMTSIEGDGRAIIRSIDAALEDTGEPQRVRDSIGYINSHGSATRQNDQAEGAAFRTVFGERAKSIPVNSTKAMIGHALGAAGIIEVVHLLLSVRNRTVTPAVNAEVKDPAFLFLPDVVLDPYTIAYALKTASGFGGIHSALIFKDFTGK